VLNAALLTVRLRVENKALATLPSSTPTTSLSSSTSSTPPSSTYPPASS
jgi:hypothetical protein